MTGLHREITLSFMLVGYTKFAPDWSFGLFKQRYRRTFVSCLDDIFDVVNSSADVNVAQLVGSQDGTTIVPVYDWVPFLRDHFRNLPQLKSFHHFTFSSFHPGLVTRKEFSESNAVSFTMPNDDDWTPISTELPQQIHTNGLSETR